MSIRWFSDTAQPKQVYMKRERKFDFVLVSPFFISSVPIHNYKYIAIDYFIKCPIWSCSFFHFPTSDVFVAPVHYFAWVGLSNYVPRCTKNKTYHLFLLFSVSLAILCFVLSYTSSLACIRILYGNVPSVVNCFWLFCCTHSNDPCGPCRSISWIWKLNFCSHPFAADENVKICNNREKINWILVIYQTVWLPLSDICVYESLVFCT